MKNTLTLKSGIKADDLITITNTNSQTMIHANLIMENKFFLRSNLDIIDFTSGLDWDYTHHIAANTYQLYLHALEPIGILCNAFIETNDHKYIDKSLQILSSWIKYSSSENNNKLIWSDHSTASRTIILSYLFTLIHENGIPINNNLVNSFKQVMLKNIDFLYSDTAYIRNNHGLMMDRALMQSCIIFDFQNNGLYFDKATYRIKENFYNSFSAKGTHLENSPEYHLLVLRLFNSIEKFLNKYNHSLGEDVTHLLYKANEYYRYILKPNKYLPLIGDTKRIKLSNIQKKYNSFYDYEAGIAILQSKSDVETNSTWLSFIAGYSMLSHKHFDDLSITLYHNGHDIFVDSGQHSYSNSKERFYVKSAKAHNTVTLDKENYKLLKPKLADNKIKISNYTTNEIYDYVKGINLGYKNSSITRSILFIKKGIIFILDTIDADNSVSTISQHFNLAPHINILSKEDNKVILNSDGSKIIIEQLNNVDELILHKGDTEIPYAIMSEKFAQVTPITQLEFQMKRNQEFYLTLIKLNDSNHLANIQFDISTQRLSFNLNLVHYSLIL